MTAATGRLERLTQRLRPRALRPAGRPGTRCRSARAGGTTAHGMDHGRRGGQGAAVPLRRRAAAAASAASRSPGICANTSTRPATNLPGWARLGLRWLPRNGLAGRLLACAARRNALRLRPPLHRRLQPRRSPARRRSAAPPLAGLHRRSARRGDHHRGRGRRNTSSTTRPDRGPEPRRSTPGRRSP